MSSWVDYRVQNTSLSYDRRKSKEKAEFTNEVLKCIGVGQSNAKKIKTIIASEEVAKFKKLDAQKADSFRKEVFRVLKKHLSSTESGLKKIKISNVDCYYWSDKEEKNDVLAQFEMSEPRALAFHFIEKYLSLLIPPHIHRSLATDFEKANTRLQATKHSHYFKKLDFNPLGFDTLSNISHEEFSTEELERWQLIFNFTFKEKAFNASYQSIHSQYSGELTLSPQKIVMLNHQMMVLALEHKTNSLKFFEIERLNSVKEGLVSFQKADERNYKSSHKFKAVCHTWVRNYFESVHLGDATKFTKTEYEDCWLLESNVEFPLHFNDNKPDAFFFANYLGMFGDSIAVEQPLFLKQELKRRAAQQYQYHTGTISAFDMVAASPKTMARESN